MGLNVYIYIVGYEMSVLLCVKFVEFGYFICIEDDCWIGGNVIILFNVIIGKGCIIGVGFVVIKSLLLYFVVIGVLVKIVKMLLLVVEELVDLNNLYCNMLDCV